MAYDAYETSAGFALADVQALCRHAARASGAFSSATIPTLAAVEAWLTTSKAWIKGLLRRAGISTTQTDAAVLGILQQLNVYDVCIKVELSLPAENSTGEGNNRFDTFEERRKELMEMIGDGTLAGMGAITAPSDLRSPIIGGERYSRKAVANDDTDRVQHRVKRDMFINPAVEAPSSPVALE